MPREQAKFRPNEPKEQREWQESVARELGIEHDAEFFKVPVEKEDGTVEIHYIAKHAGQSQERMKKNGQEESKKEETKEEWLNRLRKMYIKGLGFVPREEVVEAVRKVFPAMENPNLKDAVLKLREMKKESK